MTVPRKVMLLCSSLGARTGTDHGGCRRGRNINTLMTSLGLAHSRTCSRRTCIHLRQDLTLPSQLRSGWVVGTLAPSSSPSRMAMCPQRAVS